MKLRGDQLRPIDHSLACCCREAAPEGRRSDQIGVRRIDDLQFPRGYRGILSNSEMRKLMERKIVAQNCACALCKEQFFGLQRHPFRTTSIPAAWEELEEAIIPTTTRRFTGV